MIATIAVKVNAAKPNFPLQPLFAFQGSPSSLRILDVPKSIGNWAITSVKVAVEYPDNTTVEKGAVRNGSVWVATVEGCEIAGKVLNGYSVLADGKDEDGNDVTGYVLGKGDVYVIENNTDISRLLDKIAVRYIEDIPDVPTKGDLMNSNGELRLFDGNDWIVISTGEHSAVYDSQITIQKNGTSVGSFTVNASEPKSIDIPVPSNVSELENDSGFITLAQVPTPSYIEDANGNKVEADLDCIAQDLTLPWTLVDGQDTYTLNYDEQTSKWRYEEAETKKIELSYGTQYSIWELDFYLWNNDEWHFDTGSTTTQEKEATSLTILEWTLTRSILKNDKLAKESDLPTKTSDLVNDSGFITASQVPPVPSNLSEYNNDVGFITASAIPSNVGAFTNDAGYLTSTSSAFTAKRDKSDLAYKVGFDKNNLDKVVKFVVEYVDGNNQNVTATLDKYDEFTQTWTGENTNWKVYTYLVGMEPELYFELSDGTGGQADQPAPSQGAEDTSWNFTYNSNPATWTMVMTQNIALQQDFKNLRDMKDISYPASVDSTGMYTIQKFNVNGTEVAHFTTSGSTSTWDTNDPVVNQYEISTTDGTNFTLVSNGTQLGTFTMTSLKNGVVDVTYDGRTYTVGATFKQTTFALKDYVDAQATSIPSATSDLVNDSGFITASAIPSNVGAFTNDVGYLTAASTTIQNLQNKDTDHEFRIREVEKQATGARYWMDLSYPTVNANAQDGFGIAGFTVDFPSYGSKPSTSFYMSFVSVSAGTALWKSGTGNLAMRTSDGIHFSYYNNSVWMDFPLNNTSPTEAWTHYFAQGIRPAYITATFKSNTMKKIALEDYVDANLNVSGIGCSTVTMSGVYADTTTFSYNVVVAQ